MTRVLTEIGIILLLLAANGVFAMTEIAVVSSRKSRLRRMALGGDPRAAAALELAQSPNRFLATVQVGITLVGVLAGALGGATLAEQIGLALASVPIIGPYGEAIGIGIVVVTITYLSLIIGELVPKRLGLSDPEGVARLMAKPMKRLAILGGPIVRLLECSTDLALRLLAIKSKREPQVTDEEVKLLLQEGVEAGVFHKSEPPMVERVLGLDQLPVRDIMTPRVRIVFLNRTEPHESIWQKIVVSGHSSFPVYEGNRDNVAGIVSVKAIYANLAAGQPVQLGDLMVPPLIVPTSQTVTRLLETFRQSRKHIALAADEFGTIAGLVTLVDVLEAITGDMPSAEQRSQPQAKRREDGTWLIDGMIDIEELEHKLPGLRFPKAEAREYETLAGFIVTTLEHLPREGESVEWMNHRFEVLDMDRNRVDKILVAPLKGQSSGQGIGHSSTAT